MIMDVFKTIGDCSLKCSALNVQLLRPEIQNNVQLKLLALDKRFNCLSLFNL